MQVLRAAPGRVADPSRTYVAYRCVSSSDGTHCPVGVIDRSIDHSVTNARLGVVA
jgi:hypothetical protein